MTELDPFNVFRTALFLGVGAYTVLTTLGTIWRVVGLLRGRDPRKRLLRSYLSYQLATVSLRPLAGELAEIACWLAALIGIWRLHDLV
jgi:hypothetical protein